MLFFAISTLNSDRSTIDLCSGLSEDFDGDIAIISLCFQNVIVRVIHVHEGHFIELEVENNSLFGVFLGLGESFDVVEGVLDDHDLDDGFGEHSG